MKVTVKRRERISIHTEYIKLQDAMKLAGVVMTGGEAKAVIQNGEVFVAGEPCLARGKKLHDGEEFSYQGKTYKIQVCT